MYNIYKDYIYIYILYSPCSPAVAGGVGGCRNGNPRYVRRVTRYNNSSFLPSLSPGHLLPSLCSSCSLGHHLPSCSFSLSSSSGERNFRLLYRRNEKTLSNWNLKIDILLAKDAKTCLLAQKAVSSH